MSPDEYEEFFVTAKRLGLSFAAEPGTTKEFMEDASTTLYLIEYRRWLDANPVAEESEAEAESGEDPDGG